MVKSSVHIIEALSSTHHPGIGIEFSHDPDWEYFSAGWGLVRFGEHLASLIYQMWQGNDRAYLKNIDEQRIAS